MLQDVTIAILATLWMLAPLGVLLWFNWRAAVFGPLAFVCLGVFPLAMFAAGNSAWQPTAHNPVVFMLICWALAAAGLIFSVRMMGSTWVRRFVALILGIAVSSWILTFYPAAESFWSTVGTPR